MEIELRDEVREYPKGTTVLEIAESISPNLARMAVCGKVGEDLIDLKTKLVKDCKLTIITNRDPEYKMVLRHSTAHCLAQAVKAIYPTAKLSIGPATEEGFYYDFDFKTPITQEDLPKIEAEMKRIIKADFEITRKEITREKALKLMDENEESYKVELIDAIPEGEKITMYSQGDFFDICRGPHLRSTGMIKAFKLTKIAGAYWRGDEKNKMLTRIYGVAFDKASEMEEYFKMVEEAEKRDHRKLGKELDLFFLSDYAPGMPFFMPKGQVVINELINFWREEHKKAGYVEITTPIALNRELWEKSGHWDHYKKNMYTFKVEDDTFAVKPMNCPGGMLFYKERVHSYREFPLRVAELGKVHRHEASGTLHGLFRVRCFTQDDAHIFMTRDQIEDEIANIISLVDKVYKVFGLTYKLELSTMPEDHIGTIKDWQWAESSLERALTRIGKDYVINKGDGAFYGPKIDIHIKDAIGRTWQCGTIQLDMQLPKRFELEYTASDGSRQEPIMLHRVIFGSIERFFGIITENFAGAFPLWLSPVQAVVMNVSEKSEAYAVSVAKKLEEAGIRTETDIRAEKIGYKIRSAQMQKIPYMIIIGENEAANRTVSIRKRGNLEAKDVKIEELINEMKQKIKTREIN
ncbi:MAG: threonine--tRNA ligase [Clostridia bacterium]|nr:threonine--tRNA ligase [Clostridia bacterium]